MTKLQATALVVTSPAYVHSQFGRTILRQQICKNIGIRYFLIDKDIIVTTPNHRLNILKYRFLLCLSEISVS